MAKDNGKGTELMFQTGDAVVYPIHGAGIVTGIRELNAQEDIDRYYDIKLLGQVDTNLLIPVSKAESRGLRPAITDEELQNVWEVLTGDPEKLPKNHRSRHKQVREKINTGDIVQIAEAVRDLAWRRRTEDGLTQRGRRIYKKGMSLLASEIAATTNVGMAVAKSKVRGRLKKSFSSR
jgi:CarD family transcriptional regulator